MLTTTIRLDHQLKDRIAAVAAQSGKSAHAFMLEAIAQTVEQWELDHEFSATADQRWQTVLEGGKTIPWEGAKVYLTARSRGERPRRPPARSPGR